MTVCIAALAGPGRTIVCVADKAVTYGDHIQWDADSSKITTLDNNKSLILLAGSEEAHATLLGSFAERSTNPSFCGALIWS